MSRALSRDLRDRVVAAVDGGLLCRAAAERFRGERRERAAESIQRVARAVLQARDTDPLIAELCRSEDGHEGHVCCISAYSYTHEALNRC